MQTTTRVTRCCSEFLISLFEKPDALARRLFNKFGHTFVYFIGGLFPNAPLQSLASQNLGNYVFEKLGA